MKIGIITFHWADNYGALLQAYALQKYLNVNDVQAEIINYVCEKAKRIYDPFYFVAGNYKEKIRGVLRCIINYGHWKKKRYGFDNFRKNMFFSKQLTREELEKNLVNYDLWIAGSDQIWNVDIVGSDIDLYSLGFSEGNKISYGASSGRFNMQSREYDILQKNLKNFYAISVREKSTKNILNESLKRDVDVVVDPTMLLEKSEWMEIIPKTQIYKNKYVFLYYISSDEQLIEITKFIAQQRNLDIVVCGHLKELKGIAKQFKSLSPEEFLNMLYYAEYVVTSSFHATIFSILFEKQFITVQPGYASERIVDLCDMLKLSDRCVTNIEQVRNVEKIDIEYDELKSILNDNTIKSKQFLNSVVERFKAKEYEQ